MFKTMDMLHKLGWNSTGDKSTEDVFIAGHSLGCAGARGFIIEHDDYAGLLCFGTQANATDLDSPNAPLLMFSGELDGLSVTEFQPFYKNYLAMQRAEGDFKALKERAVVVVPGLSHSDFCPGFDVPTDCYSELKPEEALKDIGDICASWLALQVSDPKSDKAASATKALLGWTEKTDEFLQPFMKLSAMEETSWCSGASVFLSVCLSFCLSVCPSVSLSSYISPSLLFSTPHPTPPPLLLSLTPHPPPPPPQTHNNSSPASPPHPSPRSSSRTPTWAQACPSSSTATRTFPSRPTERS